jgi:hypothetical protein
MKKYIISILIFYITILSFSQDRVRYKPKYYFKDFKVKINSFNTVQRANFKTNPDAIRFRTKITEALKNTKNPNFAGHYLVVEWGCGPSCQCNVIIDMINGNVYEGICTSESYASKSNSRLFITDPADENSFYDLRSVVRLAPTEYVWNEKRKKLEKLK